jgi:hypothetical protein
MPRFIGFTLKHLFETHIVLLELNLYYFDHRKIQHRELQEDFLPIVSLKQMESDFQGAGSLLFAEKKGNITRERLNNGHWEGRGAGVLRSVRGKRRVGKRKSTSTW